MSEKTTLRMILAKDKTGAFRLWACRGEGKGCERNRYRNQMKPCDDCFGPCNEGSTLEEIMDEISRGDA